MSFYIIILLVFFFLFLFLYRPHLDEGVFTYLKYLRLFLAENKKDKGAEEGK
ncbi:MAG TPA: hypothetical protein GXZ20_03735 [Halanaerobiaceae bacterium]|nr:hypothetical protein [Bacillota bacterium]HHU92237.1 hypothetical protein [Halanaerobiaceae bacterium]HOA40013.1 hypothetical protein [Halanaerobiales bacterium]HPZ62089.1 hypothetical protein [Halanaerobiales bacterium]HQD03414.1 hypothetical protein [Halanaerobiales bacterium]